MAVNYGNIKERVTMRAALEETLSKNGLMVIGGSMSTALEKLGASLNYAFGPPKYLRKRRSW